LLQLQLIWILDNKVGHFLWEINGYNPTRLKDTNLLILLQQYTNEQQKQTFEWLYQHRTLTMVNEFKLLIRNYLFDKKNIINNNIIIIKTCTYVILISIQMQEKSREETHIYIYILHVYICI